MASELPAALEDLGPGPELVYRVLRECEPATAQEVSERTCRSRHVAWSCLEQLRDEGLVERHPVVIGEDTGSYRYRVI